MAEDQNDDKFLFDLEANIHKLLIAEYQGTSLRSKKGYFIQTVLSS